MIPVIIQKAAIEGDILEAYDLIEPLVRMDWHGVLPEVRVELEKALDALFAARVSLDEVVGF